MVGVEATLTPSEAFEEFSLGSRNFRLLFNHFLWEYCYVNYLSMVLDVVTTTTYLHEALANFQLFSEFSIFSYFFNEEWPNSYKLTFYKRGKE